MSEKVKRLYSVDVFRIVCALGIFLFHSHGFEGICVDFCWLNGFVSNAHIIMVAFFMLSGFSLHYAHSNKKSEAESAGRGRQIAGFYLRRLAGIYPLYLFTALLHNVLYNKLSLAQNFALAPLQLSLLQSMHHKSFFVSHFGGTWFISCLFICYLFFPFAKEIIIDNRPKTNFVLLFFLWFFCSYQFVLERYFDFAGGFTAIYNNIMVRFFEFFSGMIVADLFLKNKEKYISKKFWFAVPAAALALFAVITVTTRFKNISLFFFTFFAFPAFASILYLCGRLEFSRQISFGRKAILVLSENTYAFYLAQFFTWAIIKDMNASWLHLENAPLLAFCFVWCCAVSAIMHYCVEKPCKRFLLAKIKKSGY